MYAVDFENRPGDLGATAIVLADAPEAALEKVFNLFPEYRRVSRRGHVFEIDYAEIDWDTGRAFVIQVKKRPPRLQDMGDARQGPEGRRTGGRAARMSVTQVWERLFIGGIGDAEALAESNPSKSPQWSPCAGREVQKGAPGINYLHFPLRDARPIPVGRFDEIIDALWENIRWGKVLIHSLAGASRSPIIAAAWMHVVGCKDIDAALADIGRLRTVEPNPILLESVKEEL